jgi:myo-inositol-1(or 4)-monophosphatase
MDARQGRVTQPSTYLPIAAQAVDLATQIVRERLPSVVDTKGDRDMVSDIDLEIERNVRRFLHKQSPEVAFVGEEEGNGVGGGALQWVLDPVDGTANFVKGIPLYSISLALAEGGEPVLGIIDVPAFGCRYSAAAGCGAYCGDTPIRVRPTSRLKDAIVSVGDYAVGEQAEGKNRVRLAVTARLAAQVQRVRMFGSAAIDLAWLAHGRTDAAIIFGNHPWDIAAGVILVREAGGLVVGAEGEKHTMWSGSTVAASAELSGEMLDLIASSA